MKFNIFDVKLERVSWKYFIFNGVVVVVVHSYNVWLGNQRKLSIDEFVDSLWQLLEVWSTPCCSPEMFYSLICDYFTWNMCAYLEF